MEVTGVSNNNRKTKAGGTTKGKGKDVAEEEVASKPAHTAVSRPTRESLRATVGVAERHSRSTSVSTTTSQTLHTVVKLGVQEGDAATITIDKKTKATFTQPAVPVFRRKPSIKALDEAEADRAFKRRHTEARAPKPEDESQAEADKIAADLADLEPEILEAEAKAEEVQLWEDLDAADWDDPAMVSEYVAEVCVYLKQIEVIFNS